MPRLALQYRAQLNRGSDVDTMPCRIWRNPHDLALGALAGLDGADWWLAGIRAGGDPWLGTYTEPGAA